MNDNNIESTMYFEEGILQTENTGINEKTNIKKNKHSLVIVDKSGVNELDLSSHGDAVYTFGRNSQNSIIINSEIVSGMHGEICISNDMFYIKDKGSSNGTYMAYGPQFVKIENNKYYGGDGKDMILRLGTPKSVAGLNAVLLLYTSNATIGKWKSYNLHAGDNTIGRDSTCDVKIKNVAVSRVHAGIRYVNGTYYVYDNKSTNGVFVNGIKIAKPVALVDKDIFTILNTTFIFSGNQLFYKVNPEGIALNVRDLKKVVSAKEGRKTILDNVSLEIGANEFVAIIGGSGAGKTTLMTAMSGFDTSITGEVFCNGINLRENFQTLKNIIGFVPQQDIIYENITLKKMLYYTAKLKMPEDTSNDEIAERINDVLRMVELSEHQDTFIRRLSGGQKKRASIAVELLANPGLFFLDEPTSGLDPGTEEHLMHTLKTLSKEQEKTVIMVTHTTNNLHLCDKIIIMGNGGKLCYCGTPDGIKEFFETDDLVRVYNKVNADTLGWESRFKQSGLYKVDKMQFTSEKEINPKKVSNFNQLSVLIRRYMTLIKNDLERLAMIFAQPIVIGLLLALVAEKGIYEKLLETRSIMFALMSAGIWMGLFNTIQEIYKERVILKREYMGNLKLPLYIFSKYVVQALVAAIQSVLMVGTYLIFWGAPHCKGVVFGSAAFELMFTIFITIYVSACFGLLISAISKSGDRAMAIAPLVLMVQLLFSGILFALNDATDKISYLTFSRFSIEALGSTNDLNSLEPIGGDAQEDIEEKMQKLLDECNNTIAKIQSEYAEKINSLQNQLVDISILMNKPIQIEEFVPEPIVITMDDIEESSDDADVSNEKNTNTSSNSLSGPNSMYSRDKGHMFKCWLILYGETFLFAGLSILALRRIKNEQR